MSKESYRGTELDIIPNHWEIKELDQILINRSEKYTPVKNEYKKYIALEHIEQGNGRILGYGNSSETTSLKNSFYKSDILFGKLRPYLRKYWLCDFDGVCSTEILTLRAKDDFNPLYCFYLIQQDSFIENISSKAFGTKMPRTSWNDIKKFKFPIPQINEQERIADILMKLDIHIKKIELNISDFSLLKKVIVKKLLAEGIEHTEFIETEIGRIPKSWSVKKLGDIIIEKPMYGSGMSAYDYDINMPRYVRITDINESGKLNSMDVKSCPLENNECYKLKDGDFLFARTGATVGKTYKYMEDDGICVFAGYLIKFQPNPNIINIDFLHYVTHSTRYYNWIKSTLREGAQPNINAQEYSNLLIELPPLEEQNKIVEILNSLDKQIDVYIHEKFDFIELKNGLMQKLLTGKIRVKTN